jgi:hypothetical protein
MRREDAKVCLLFRYLILLQAPIHNRHPEVLASSASLEGRRPGCISTVHPSRLSLRCVRIACFAPQDDGIDTASAEGFWIASLRSQ